MTGSPSSELGYDAQRRVLAIDDNPVMLRALVRMLSPSCYVMTSRDGEDALSKARHFGPFSVVLTDQRMPKLTGTKLVDRIKQLSPGTACVLLTANPHDAGIQERLGDGRLNRLLVKPCPIDEIIDAVHAADRVSRDLSPDLPGAAIL